VKVQLVRNGQPPLGFRRCADAPASERDLYGPAQNGVPHFTYLGVYSVKDATGGDLFAYRSERTSLQEKDHVSVFTGRVYL
jgi:hypothetical protein